MGFDWPLSRQLACWQALGHTIGLLAGTGSHHCSKLPVVPFTDHHTIA